MATDLSLPVLFDRTCRPFDLKAHLKVARKDRTPSPPPPSYDDDDDAWFFGARAQPPSRRTERGRNRRVAEFLTPPMVTPPLGSAGRGWPAG